MIKTENLKKAYDKNIVLNLPDLQIGPGESFGLVGNNGAGKTTFFSLILDLIEATEGRILSNEENVKQSEHWKRYTGAYLDENFLIDFLTPDEYFEFIARLYQLSKQDYDDFLEIFSSFFKEEIVGTKKFIRELSKGNQKKVGIAAAFMSRPDVIILDEPFPHLDPSSVMRLKEIIQKERNERNPTVLISSHDLNHITEVCERIVLLEKGDVLKDLRSEENALQALKEYFQ
jgi:ABC-2 type transport system ATP-binding protein